MTTEDLLSETDLAFEVRGLTKRFGDLEAVQSVDLGVKAGEIHGIIGRNGAGKSVLLSMMAGILQPSTGTIVVRGSVVDAGGYSPGVAHALGVTLIPQEPLFAQKMSVVDNLFLGAPITRRGMLDRKQMCSLAMDIGARLQLSIDVNGLMEHLGVEEQQLLAFGKAIFIEDAQVVLLDEITASLSSLRKHQVLDLMREQSQASGRAFILISHHISEILECCDQVSVMRDGHLIATLYVHETNAEQLARHIVGDLVDAPLLDIPREPGAVVVDIQELSSARSFDPISLRICCGEVVGLAGLDGSGKDEFLAALFGLHRTDGGTVRIDGLARQIDSPTAAHRAGIAYLPKNRDELAVIPRRSVEENTLISVYPTIANRLGLINYRRGRALIRERFSLLQVKASSLRSSIDTLSGGNRQKVIINRVSMTKPRLFVLCEPTRGVDIATRPDITHVIRTQFTSGSAVLLTSESEEEMIDTCDRILVFLHGRVTREIRRGSPEFTSAALYRFVQGVDISQGEISR